MKDNHLFKDANESNCAGGPFLSTFSQLGNTPRDLIPVLWRSGFSRRSLAIGESSGNREDACKWPCHVIINTAGLMSRGSRVQDTHPAGTFLFPRLHLCFSSMVPAFAKRYYRRGAPCRLRGKGPRSRSPHTTRVVQIGNSSRAGWPPGWPRGWKEEPCTLYEGICRAVRYQWS
jgi:hypothetical protein